MYQILRKVLGVNYWVTMDSLNGYVKKRGCVFSPNGLKYKFRGPDWDFPRERRNVKMLKPRILIVDDAEDLVKTMVKRLNKRNIEATGVLSGEEALETIRKETFDIVVLDVKMPGITGIETLRELKKIDPGIEVILLTGHASVDVALDGMKLGAYEFLMKPCKIEELVEKIDGAWEIKTERDKRIRKAEVRAKE